MGDLFLSQNPWEFCVLFSRTDSRLSKYRLVIFLNFNFLHNSQGTPFPTLSCLVVYLLCVSLMNLFIMWLIDSFHSPHNQHLLFCCISSIFASTKLVLKALFCAAFRKKIQFLSEDFSFLSTPKSLRVRFCQFTVLNYYWYYRYYLLFVSYTSLGISYFFCLFTSSFRIKHFCTEYN